MACVCVCIIVFETAKWILFVNFDTETPVTAMWCGRAKSLHFWLCEKSTRVDNSHDRISANARARVPNSQITSDDYKLWFVPLLDACTLIGTEFAIQFSRHDRNGHGKEKKNMGNDQRNVYRIEKDVNCENKLDVFDEQSEFVPPLIVRRRTVAPSSLKRDIN